MSAITRVKANPFAALWQVFAAGEDIEDNNYKFNDEQKASQLKADEIMEEASKPINVNGGKANKKGGFVKKMDTNPELGKAMREKHDQKVRESQEKGIEL